MTRWNPAFRLTPMAGGGGAGFCSGAWALWQPLKVRKRIAPNTNASLRTVDKDEHSFPVI